MSLVGGTSNGPGGALRTSTRLQLSDVDFIGNTVTGGFGEGGAMHVTVTGSAMPADGVLLQRVRFAGNTAATGGGAITIETNIFTNIPPVVFDDVTFEDNSTPALGGAVAVHGGINGGVLALSIANSRFLRNSAGTGGAIGYNSSVTSSTLTVVDSVFEENVGTTVGQGGAISHPGTVSVLRSRFTGNRAGAGGAIRARTAEVIDSELCDNEALRDGGAIRVFNGSLTIGGSTFCRNAVTTSDTSQIGGGAIAVTGTAGLSINRSTFDGNSALRGGAISHAASGNLVINGATVVAPAVGMIGATGSALRLAGTVPGALRDLRNSLLRGSCSFGSSDDQWTAAHGNIESGGNGCRFGSAAAGSNNMISVAGSALELAALADNGGPTRTRMPGAGSAMVESGSNTDCSALDQRGLAVTDGNCDIGAVERNAGFSPGDLVFHSGFED
jgi:predicted outer membrane repeat protein